MITDMHAVKILLSKVISIIDQHEQEMTMQIADHLKSEENLQAACAIEQAVQYAKASVQLDFWKCLKERLTDKLGFVDSDFIQSLAFDKDKVKKFYQSRPERCFGIGFSLHELPSGQKLALLVELFYGIYYGIILLDEKGVVGNAGGCCLLTH